MTQRDRILAALAAHGPLDDDRLSELAGVRPRQAVNRICRELARDGTLERGPLEAGGKIHNALIAGGTTAPGDRRERKPRRTERPALRGTVDACPSLDPETLRHTLFVLPCSKRKRGGGKDAEGPTVLSDLSPDVASGLSAARRIVAPPAGILERSPLLPAWIRYAGHLYDACRPALQDAVRQERHVLILSGGYGVVRADEPLAAYERALRPGDWPDDLLPTALADYARERHVTHVRAVVAATSTYRKVLNQVRWPASVESAFLITPEVRPGGAQVRAPKAMGEMLTELLGGRGLSAVTSMPSGLAPIIRCWPQ